MPPLLTLLLLCGFAFLAGFLDSIVGGGGLVQLPALLVVMPEVAVTALLGTNKLSSIAGTSIAVVQYARRVEIPWGTMLPAAAMAFACSFLGALLATQVPANILRPLILVLLIGVALYTFYKKDFGAIHAPKLSARWQLASGLAVSGVIGFYDGFFGPGTGSFLIFALIGVLGFGFLTASASAKVVNAATNLAAVILFAATGNILYHIALPMALCNIAGSLLGSHVAIKQGAGFIRLFFLAVVLAIISKFAYDLWKP